MTSWTTLLQWIGMPRLRSTPVPQRPTRLFPVEQSTPHVPHEYRALYTYLEHRYAGMAVLTFEQIEALLGFPLPAPARTDQDWWTDRVDPHAHSAAWTGAGRTAAPNFSARTVTFERSR